VKGQENYSIKKHIFRFLFRKKNSNLLAGLRFTKLHPVEINNMRITVNLILPIVCLTATGLDFCASSALDTKFRRIGQLSLRSHGKNMCFPSDMKRIIVAKSDGPKTLGDHHGC
jgi:hypothetical protein